MEARIPSGTAESPAVPRRARDPRRHDSHIGGRRVIKEDDVQQSGRAGEYPAQAGKSGEKRRTPADADRAAEDRRLLERYRATGDQEAREALVQRFLPLARQLARRYRRGGEPLDDLIQVASLGLLKAIDRFDPQRQTAFSSFAVPTILGELKRHFRDKGWSVRVPRDLQELAMKVDKTGEEMARTLGRAPTVDELAEQLEVTQEQVLEAREASAAYRAVSLDRPRGDDEDDADGFGATFGFEDPAFGAAEDSATISRLLRVLTDREREVLRLRFEEDLTQSEIGERVGVSQMHVSRLIRQAVSKLREAAETGS
jgi:RNA polymerase sigma-B factor